MSILSYKHGENNKKIMNNINVRSTEDTFTKSLIFVTGIHEMIPKEVH